MTLVRYLTQRPALELQVSTQTPAIQTDFLQTLGHLFLPSRFGSSSGFDLSFPHISTSPQSRRFASANLFDFSR